MDAVHGYVERHLVERVGREVGRPRRVTEEGLHGTAAEILGVRRPEVQHAGLRDDAGQLDPDGPAVEAPAEAAQAASWPPAEWPRARTRSRGTSWSCQCVDGGGDVVERLRGRRHPRRRRRRPGGTRCSTRPSRGRPGSAASGRPRDRSYAAFQNPPWITTTVPFGVPDGSVSSANWLGSAPYSTRCAGAPSRLPGRWSPGDSGRRRPRCEREQPRRDRRSAEELAAGGPRTNWHTDREFGARRAVRFVCRVSRRPPGADSVPERAGRVPRQAAESSSRGISRWSVTVRDGAAGVSDRAGGYAEARRHRQERVDAVVGDGHDRPGGRLGEQPDERVAEQRDGRADAVRAGTTRPAPARGHPRTCRGRW